MKLLKNTQQKLFLLTISVGMVAVIVSNAIDLPDRLGVFTPSLLVIIVQIIYLVSTVKLKLTYEYGVIDSYYYLGFLFTLVAMVASFYSFDTENLKTQDISQLIAQNGVALSSTIFGMTTRLILRMINEKENVVEYHHPTDEEMKIYITLIKSLRAINEDLKNISDISSNAKGASKETKIFNDNLTTTANSLNALNNSISLLQTGSTAAEITAKKALASLIKSLKSNQQQISNENINISQEVQELVLSIHDHLNNMSKQASNIEGFNKKLLKMYSLLNDRVSQLLDDKNVS